MIKSNLPGPTNSSSPTPHLGFPATLDPKLVALAAARNIGALATVKAEGRPRLWAVNYTFDPATALARISVIEDRVMVHDLRRDPRASIFVGSPDGRAFAVLEGTVELSPVAAAPDDDAVEELVEVYRSIRGVNHPEWDDFRAAMVADRRLVARLSVELAYGLPGPDFDIPA
jgi:PPOX class probable F420-dependent enzyme